MVRRRAADHILELNLHIIFPHPYGMWASGTTASNQQNREVLAESRLMTVEVGQNLGSWFFSRVSLCFPKAFWKTDTESSHRKGNAHVNEACCHLILQVPSELWSVSKCSESYRREKRDKLFYLV